MPIPTSPTLPRVNRGPSILAARIASPRHGPPLSSRYAAPPLPSSLTSVPDEDRSDHSDSSASSLTSKAVDAVIANATRSPTLSFQSPHSIQPLSALSSSLRAYSLMKGGAGMLENKEDLSPDDVEDSYDYPHPPHYSIIPYSVDRSTPRAHRPSQHSPPPRTTAHSSTSSSHLSSMSSSPGSSNSTSPSSVSPYPTSPAGSPSLPPPSVPRPIPGASDVVLPTSFPLVPLSSSAPVSSIHLTKVEDDDEDVSDLPSSQPWPSPTLKSQHSSHQLQGHHQLLSKSKVDNRKEGTAGISSISSLINPSSPSHPHHEAFKRSRRLSQSSLTESPRTKNTPSPVDPEHMIVSCHTLHPINDTVSSMTTLIV